MAEDSFFNEKRILIIDESAKATNDRTWCFWSTKNYPYQSTQQKSWPKLTFKSDHLLRSDDIAPYTYWHTRGIDFYKEMKQKFCSKENITWSQDKVLNIQFNKGISYVKTQNARYEAPLVFNSIISLSGSKLSKPKLWQHFYGFRIKTAKPYFDKTAVTLMDFSLSDNDKHVQFGYILPFAEDEALIEFTEFSGRNLEQEIYECLLSKYLDDLGIDAFTILEKEIGRIPMTMNKFDRQKDGIINIGTAGGMTKPTTGYTFRNIQEDTHRIINGLKSNQLDLKVRAKRRFNFYDKLLLGIIEDEPQKVKPIMSSLFKRNKIKQILKFLDEKTSLTEEIRIFLSIPWAPFLRQLTKK